MLDKKVNGDILTLVTKSTQIAFAKIKHAEATIYQLILVLEKTPNIDTELQTALSMKLLSQLRNLLIGSIGLKDLISLAGQPVMPNLLSEAYAPVLDSYFEKPFFTEGGVQSHLH